MKFRTILLLSMVLLVAGILAATAGGVAAELGRAAEEGVAGELAQTRQVFEELYGYRRSLYRSQSRVVAEEPRLKAVVATEEVTHETVLGVAFELRKVLQSDLFVMTDSEGRLLADVAEPDASGHSMRDQALVAGALDKGEASGILTHGQQAYQVEARRLGFGEIPVGVLMIGYRIDGRVAETVRRQTGSEVVIELENAPIATTRALSQTADDKTLGEVLARVPTGATEPVQVVLGETHYLASAAPLEAAGNTKVRYVVLRSLDEALAPSRRASRVVFAVAAAALLCALGLTVLLSRRLSRPLDALASFVREIGAGELSSRARVEGPLEIATLSEAMNRMVSELGEAREQMAAKERLEKEMEISSRIQTCILPTSFKVEGLEIAGAMVPASEVGGDYYDVFPVEGGAWIGIGDVAGHGLTSGLIMLMVQSTIAALGRKEPDAEPKAILRSVNAVLYDNIRHRLRNDEHVTLSLLRYHRDGRIVFAGAHEEIVVCRAATGKCELIETPGTWLGAMRDVGRVMSDNVMKLEDGDIVVLYTDGITEARDANKKQFELDRMLEIVEREREASADTIRDEVLASVRTWIGDGEQEDDLTIVVIRYLASVEA